MAAPELDDLDGRAVRPGEEDYDDLVAGYNRIVQHRPEVVVEAGSAEDVARAVRHARAAGLGVGVLCSGHGPSRAADGVLVRTHRLTGLDVDPVARTATVQAGVLSGQLVAAAAAHGLAPLNGSSPGVGVVGYTLGGGVALLGRLHGWASERVRRLQVVLADGTVRSVGRESTGEDRELFWALLGTKDTLGIVTELEIDLLPIAQVDGGGLWWVEEDVPSAVRSYIAWTRTAPTSMGSSVLVMRMPDAEFIAAPLRGRHVAHVRLLHVGDTDEAQRLVAPLRALPGVVQDTFGPMPYGDVGSIHSDPAGPTVFEASNTLLGELDEAGVDALVAALRPDAGFLVELRHLGGRLAESTQQSVAGRKDGVFTLYAGAPVLSEPRETVAQRQGELHARMAPWGVGGPCQSFLSGPGVTPEELARGYAPDDLARVVALKERLDPQDVLDVHVPLRVPPEQT